MTRTAIRKAALALAAALVVALLLPFDGIRAQSHTVVVNGHEAVAGEALVRFRTPPGRGDVEQDTDADVNEAVGNHGVRRVHSRSLDTPALMATLGRRGDVLYAEPNYILRADAIPTDSNMNLLWGLVNTGQTIGGQAGTPGADVAADQAWNVTTGSRTNVVAVVDTGIDYTHPDLAANIWSAPLPFTVTVGGTTISCAAGTHGFNAIAKTCNPMDDNNHGTHVSGTIGAQGNNGFGVAGVNWVASIMALKFLNSQGTGTTSDAINAIEFAIQAKRYIGTQANVRVLSNSWGGGAFSQALLDEINRAAASDMLFVAAAGNGGADNDATPSYPASYQAGNVIAVAATDNRDNLASFSNYGASSVEVGAPGVSIVSTVRAGGYAYMSGTSMAAPHVSGTAVLTLAVCPSLTTSDLSRALLASVDQLASLAGKTLTGGRINAFKAVSSCTAAAPPPAAADFTLSAAASSVLVRRGSSNTIGITIARTGGFAGSVTLGLSALPSGVTGGFNPNNTTASSSTLTLAASNFARKGSATVTVTGSASGLTRTTSLQVQVR